MISKSVLRTVASDQIKELEKLQDFVPRDVFQEAKLESGGNSAFVVKGVRRCGKSTFLKQLMNAKFPNNFFYFDFDDERILDFEANDFQSLVEVLIELFGNKKAILLDEIQNIHGWELFVNRLIREGYKIFITGSNANLLSKELGTHLTGRHTDIELFPFSFKEFLISRKVDFKDTFSTQQKVTLLKNFAEYLSKGGMPESVLFSNETILSQIFNDIVQKDILGRYKIRKPNELKAILKFLISNTSNPVTYRSLKNNFAINSSNTVQKYSEYAQETYIIFIVKKFEKKVKKLEKNPIKVYCIDNGIVVRNSPQILERKSYLLENLVAVQLERLGKEFYYYKKKGECDFVVPNDKTAIQVCYELNKENKDREVNGLLEAIEEFQTNSGLLLTYDQEEEFKVSKKTIKVLPVWKWLLS